MRWLWRICVPLLIVAALAYVLYPRRYQAMAKFWHWRHGDETHLGNYVIPVPADWFAKESSTSEIEMADTGFASRPYSLSGISSVRLFLPPIAKDVNLESWRALQRQLLSSKGIRALEEHTIHYDDESVACVGGDLIEDAMRIPLAGFTSVNCESTGRMHLLFSGFKADLPSFYNFVAGIHKMNETR
jgi:hypothetical protein